MQKYYTIEPNVEANVVASGNCGVNGDNVKWKLTDDKVLTISGEGEMDSWSTEADVPWYSSKNLIRSVAIGDDVTKIGDNAFSGLRLSTELKIPNSVTSIGDYAFADSVLLKSIEIPNSVTSIGEYAFFYSFLKSIKILNSKTCIGNYAFAGSSLNLIELPDSITSISDGAFCRSKLISIEIPDSVTSIGENAFSGCEDLSSVKMSKNITSIGEYAFSGCKSLAKITIPPNVTRIGSGAFSYCSSLTEIDIPKGVTKIERQTFEFCESLERVGIPDGVVEIWSQAFCYCKKLTSVTVPNSVKIISNEAFFACYELRNLMISANIESLENSAFASCGKLELIRFHGTEEEWNRFIENDGRFLNNYLNGNNGKVEYGVEAHELEDKVIAPTCTTDGYTLSTCTLCKYAEKSDIEPALGHSYKEEVTTQATCIDTGVKTITCSRSQCDYHKEEPLAALGHDYKGEITTPATSTTEGLKTYTCTRCNDQYTEKVPATGTSSGSSSSGSSGGSGGFTGSYNHPVGVDNADNAAVSLDKSNAIAGETVTITVTPEAGKVVDNVIVTDKDNHALNVTKVGDNQYQFVMPNGAVKIAVTTKDAVYGERIVLQIDNRNVLVNNYTITNDVAPVIVDNRTMVPIRIVTETLGGTADWNEDLRMVTLHIDGKTLRMTIDQTIEGFDVPPVIMNARTYVPVRYVAEKLGAKVDWIAETQQIIVTK